MLNMKKIKLQIAIGSVVLVLLGISVGLWIASQIVGVQ